MTYLLGARGEAWVGSSREGEGGSQGDSQGGWGELDGARLGRGSGQGRAAPVAR